MCEFVYLIVCVNPVDCILHITEFGILYYVATQAHRQTKTHRHAGTQAHTDTDTDTQAQI